MDARRAERAALIIVLCRNVCGLNIASIKMNLSGVACCELR